ncbi:protein serine/threonine phosphatase 2C [Phlegmacium glaucopus]|nr:protein serine/threonine phosphatase 2C [Phlegmacium glaucopus]
MSCIRKITDMGWPDINALWMYTVLPDPRLSSELSRLSFANTIGDTDVVTFQPCPNPEFSNQDRFVIKDWSLPNGTWSFRAVFDGHAGHETADYVAAVLPNIIRNALAEVIVHDHTPDASTISNILTTTIASFDEDIGRALLTLFPDPEALAKLSDEEIREIINDGGSNSTTILRCIRGTTVLISLVNPSRTSLWIASLGDCAAVLGTKEPSGEWSSKVLSFSHNGENPAEANKVREQHPGEPQCMYDNRVLGAIAVTRAIGDFSFKFPAVYTERVFLNANPGFEVPDKVRGFIGRNITPPYMSGVPEVQHVELVQGTSSFLLMCSDGLMDLYEDQRLELDEILSKRWVGKVGSEYEKKGNLALSVLRDALGGEDEEKVSRMMTVEMSFKWMDDTTILVQMTNT